MKAILFCTVVLLALLGNLVRADIWSDCGNGSEQFKIVHININPDPPVSGQEISVQVMGTLEEEVQGGTAHIQIKYNEIPLLDKTVDLCSILPELKCPVPKGDFNRSIKETIPGFAPAGHYVGTLQLTDSANNPIACLKFDFDMGASAAVGYFPVNIQPVRSEPFPDTSREDSNMLFGYPEDNEQDPMVLDDNLINSVNKQFTWVAGRNKRFEGVRLSEARRLLGAKLMEGPGSMTVEHYTLPEVGLPSAFDSRKQWPGCIHPIRNQEQCGSCWAFSATEVLSDRFCISSKNKTNVILSPQDLVSCDRTDFGCQGGYLMNAWNYMIQNGVVTDECMPYTSGAGVVEVCPTNSTCPAAGVKWVRYFAAANSIKTSTSVATIQTAILTTGPVQAAFSVYQDFYSYKSGVYEHVSGQLLGGHAIKIVGWGVSNGTPYWIVANSWGDNWGMNGFFWILRGSNECGIESNVVWGAPGEIKQ